MPIGVGKLSVGEEGLCNILEINTEQKEIPQLFYRIEDETKGSGLEKKIWS